ncbi:MAG TPA: hypothetical protein VFD07_10805 [Candidatus Krumholzibacteria bacterium]|nr:hypothetical protein [Candidatus Krumholzibacteria bacterium]
MLDLFDGDIQYYHESRRHGETEGVEDVPLRPVDPRSVRGSMTWSF